MQYYVRAGSLNSSRNCLHRLLLVDWVMCGQCPDRFHRTGLRWATSNLTIHACLALITTLSAVVNLRTVVIVPRASGARSLARIGFGKIVFTATLGLLAALCTSQLALALHTSSLRYQSNVARQPELHWRSRQIGSSSVECHWDLRKASSRQSKAGAPATTRLRRWAFPYIRSRHTYFGS